MIKTVFSDLTFSQALAGVVQIYFCFNLLHPPELDDSLQFLERIVCCFGSQDGARNKMNRIRKGFREFEVIRFKLDLLVSNSFLFQGFAAKVLLESDEGEVMAIFN